MHLFDGVVVLPTTTKDSSGGGSKDERGIPQKHKEQMERRNYTRPTGVYHHDPMLWKREGSDSGDDDSRTIARGCHTRNDHWDCSCCESKDY